MNTINLYELKKIQTEFPQTKIQSPKDAAAFIRQFYGDDLEIFESFFILLLNAAANTIGYAKISQGGIVSTIVDVRLIAKYAVDALATSVILCHNHPTGNLKPSDADLNLTKKAVEGLKLLDITVADHIILTSHSYYSFGENSQL